MTYKGIPFNGGLDSPTGTGAQHIVQTCQAICDFLVEASTPATLLDLGLTESIDWNNRLLFDTTGSPSVDFGNHLLADAAGGQSVDFNVRHAIGGEGNLSLDWDFRLLNDGSGQLSVDYENRLLVSQTAGAQFAWNDTGIVFFGGSPVAQQTGGTATAGIVYTATEQAMLNRIYTALRNYGLLT
jgi:hypothetical protein